MSSSLLEYRDDIPFELSIIEKKFLVAMKKFTQLKRVLVGIYIIVEDYYISKGKNNKVAEIQEMMKLIVNAGNIIELEKHIRSMDVGDIKNIFKIIKVDMDEEYRVKTDYILSKFDELIINKYIQNK